MLSTWDHKGNEAWEPTIGGHTIHRFTGNVFLKRLKIIYFPLTVALYTGKLFSGGFKIHAKIFMDLH